MSHLFIKRLISCVILFLYAHCGLAYQLQSNKNSIQEKLTLLESKEHIRLGISALNTANNQMINFRANERFPIQSTFKLIGVSAILYKNMQDPSLLKQKISYKKEDLVSWSPIAEKNIESGMTISELCSAAMKYSDNAAINLLIKKLGDQSKITEFARFLKDDSFRLDHLEPHMNSNPFDVQDTSTPNAMQNNLKNLALGNILSKSMRDQLIDWMKGNAVGEKRMRAGAPKGWIVADKTGSSDSYGIANDIGVIWPPNRSPIILAIYTVHPNKAC